MRKKISPTGLHPQEELIPGVTVSNALKLKKEFASQVDYIHTIHSTGFGTGFDTLEAVYRYAEVEHDERVRFIEEIISQMVHENIIEDGDIEIEDNGLKGYQSLKRKSLTIYGGYINGGSYWVGVYDISRVRLIVKDNNTLKKFIKYFGGLTNDTTSKYGISSFVNKYHRGSNTTSLYPGIFMYIAKKESIPIDGGDNYRYDLGILDRQINGLKLAIPETGITRKAQDYMRQEEKYMSGLYSGKSKNGRNRHRERNTIKMKTLDILYKGISGYIEALSKYGINTEEFRTRLETIRRSSWKFEKKYQELTELGYELERNTSFLHNIANTKRKFRALMKLYSILRDSEVESIQQGTENHRAYDLTTEIQVLTRNIRRVSEGNRNEYTPRTKEKGVYRDYNAELLRAVLLDIIDKTTPSP